MSIVFYDLRGRDDRRFSSHCWRVRLALAHKGLSCETQLVPFSGIGAIGDGSHRTVPVIRDGDRWLEDSWAIAGYLEDAYPDRPTLFGGAAGRALTAFHLNWTNRVLQPGLIGFIVKDIHDHLLPEDQAYFRESRERRFGRSLEAVQAGREQRLDAFRDSLAPLRSTLKRQPFLGGDAALFADYLVFGAFQWARVISPLALLAPDDPVGDWFERCLDLHGGLGRSMPAA
ncbi:MAG: glutathione S-transferase family protein [Candidatus Competibacterales bacterium]|nr:glutathione S-transferase family protein [Candidatus Competibacterales bacterium]